MSRVGKKPILIPEGVEVKVDGQKVIIRGPKGELQREIRPEIKIEIIEKKIVLSPQIETKETKALWGLSRALVNNMVEGVTKGYERKLEIEGVGFRAQLEGKNLILYVGFSHPIKIIAPDDIKFSADKNVISVSGADIEKVSQLAAQIRKTKPPEPYKGKGIRYQGEVVKKKVGKKAVATTGA